MRLLPRLLPSILLLSAAACTPPVEPVTVHYTVDGMHCDGCVAAITGKVTAIEGVSACTVNLESRSADVTVNDPALAPKVREAIERLGYRIGE
jgi:copper chaperone CopZ